MRIEFAFCVALVVAVASVAQAGNIRVSTATYLGGAANDAAAGVGIDVDRSVLVMAAFSSAKKAGSPFSPLSP